MENEIGGLRILQLTTVGLRLMAIWLLCSVVVAASRAVPSVAYYVLGGAASGLPKMGPTLAVTILAPLATNIGLATILYIYAPRIARRILPAWPLEDDAPRFAGITSGDLYHIAAFLLGVWVLVQAAKPSAVTAVTLMDRQPGTAWPRESVVALAEALILLVAGGILVFGSRGLAKFLDGLRHEADGTPAQRFSLALLIAITVGIAMVLALIRLLVK